ncbi:MULTISPECIES: RluA family pseudouridine synthase [Caproicibacterium]|uniref:RNA pseudouridylate synthase n=1 Tax=Caproicibacterium argilliputei TaxID=3030016 RepID=A0AA97DCH1_9FIRM|nr:RluA family pseudouridine synthase [Caproicibacterium argilliputei]WOC33329.1 RluA family pseudouridine synthase [Caproicibacterium argilliputei]
MRELSFTVPERYEGVSVRGFLRGPCGVSARLLAQCKRVEQGICVAGEQKIATDKLHAGEVVVLRLPQEQEGLPVHPNGAAPLAVLYEDASVLAVNKPAGMILYARAGQMTGTLRDVALTYLEARGEMPVFHPLYRLDRDTTGLVLLAKDRYSASAVPPTVQKVYWAVCEGTLSGSGTIEKPIGLQAGSKVRQCVCAEGRPSVTHWQAAAAGQGHTLVRCVLDTGRTHQIRVHMASIGHPLAGDDFYGGNRALIDRQALHCASARFVSPAAGEQNVRAPLPADYHALLCRLQLSAPELE